MSSTSTQSEDSGQKSSYTTITPGTLVSIRDPDAGIHTDECPHVDERWYIGPIKKVVMGTDRGTAYILTEGGPGKVPAYGSEVKIEDNIPDWLRAAFENSDYDTYMWYESHQPFHYLHDTLADDRCDWGDDETERTQGR